jgi:predicted ATPase with chaperone activity
MIKIIFSLIMIFSFYSCSSSIEETRDEEIKKDNEDETYVFDEMPEDVNVETSGEYFLIQIGAFTTKQSAESFASESRQKINDEISVSYNQEVNLFVVRLDSKFSNKKDAENVRDELRELKDFRDAWIVTVGK